MIELAWYAWAFAVAFVGLGAVVALWEAFRGR